MPKIDYMLTAGDYKLLGPNQSHTFYELELTKEMISEGLPRELTPTLDLGKDNRQWSKQHLKALRLILCNIIHNLGKGNLDKGKFLYSRDKKTNIPKRFNPSEVGYSSILWVIDRLQDAKILDGTRHPPRKAGDVFDEDNPSKMSNFIATKQAIDFAISLGINHQTTTQQRKEYVRLREVNKDTLVEFEWDDWTERLERQMRVYNEYLNGKCIILSTVDYPTEGFSDFGHLGQRIHLHRSFRDYYSVPKYKKEIDRMIEILDGEWEDPYLPNPNFHFGGRSGGYWMGPPFKKQDRDFIIIDGMRMAHCDFPAFHIQLCYLNAELGWYQQETNDELVEEGRGEEDAYYIHNVPRDIVKQMVLIMFNCKGKRGASLAFNNWLNKRAKPEVVRAWEFCDKTNVELMDAILEKHYKIKDYFLKGMLAGQIIQCEEANFMHHLAFSFIGQYNFPVLTVFDELIVPEEEAPMVKEFMYTMSPNEYDDSHSWMRVIPHL